MDGSWQCPAYGEGGRDIGAVCFFPDEAGRRTCRSDQQCGERMQLARQRLFRLINEAAAGGDEACQFLAQEFQTPDDLLGGDSSRER